MIRVKICGLTNRADAFAAVDHGADAVGFVLFENSKRFIPADEAVRIARALPPYVQRVAVSVNMPLEQVRELDRRRAFDVWQLHGSEGRGDCALLRPLRLIKAFGLPLMDGARPETYDVDAFLLDKLSADFGGTGETFDWTLARRFAVATDKPVILSGGLDADNVRAALDAVRPYAVDVCSGVEASHGRKDLGKLKKFIDLCKTY
ncbi:MAG: phosphoribosylanthranilate isomerase [Verrucomicrobiales bacterium]|jgi:phosphoribosylanthranilate isomerase|nr:phosphoribosylanthranilate isomerase [Verrucomicrobiales bacterium]